jgi:hypothetical protein
LINASGTSRWFAFSGVPNYCLIPMAAPAD